MLDLYQLLRAQHSPGAVPDCRRARKQAATPKHRWLLIIDYLSSKRRVLFQEHSTEPTIC